MVKLLRLASGGTLMLSGLFLLLFVFMAYPKSVGITLAFPMLMTAVGLGWVGRKIATVPAESDWLSAPAMEKQTASAVGRTQSDNVDLTPFDEEIARADEVARSRAQAIKIRGTIEKLEVGDIDALTDFIVFIIGIAKQDKAVVDDVIDAVQKEAGAGGKQFVDWLKRLNEKSHDRTSP